MVTKEECQRIQRTGPRQPLGAAASELGDMPSAAAHRGIASEAATGCAIRL